MEDRRQEVRSPLVERDAKHQTELTRYYLDMMNDVKSGVLSSEAAARQLTQKQLEMENLAGRDKLTGLLNRRRGLEEMEEVIILEKAHGHLPVLLMMDIDHFKVVNDQFGHGVGDEVLEGMGEALTTIFGEKSKGLIARVGGEEFAVLLPDPNMEKMAEIVKIAGMDISRIIGNKIRHLENKPDKVTVSMGGVKVLSGESLTEALKRADGGMYKAKRNDMNGNMGRNRAMVLMGDDVKVPDAREIKFTD